MIESENQFSNELKRKSFHFLSAGIPLGYYWTNYDVAIWVIGGLLAVAIVVEYARFYSRRANDLFNRFFGTMLREEEAQSYSGATFLLISSFLVVLLFHRDVAILCLLFLIFGDGMAAIVGKRFGRTRIFNKTLEGTLAFAVTAVTIGFFFTQVPFSIRLTGALVAAVVELLPIRTSDNLRIPILSGSVMEILYVHFLRNLPDSGHEVVV